MFTNWLLFAKQIVGLSHQGIWVTVAHKLIVLLNRFRALKFLIIDLQRKIKLYMKLASTVALGALCFYLKAITSKKSVSI